jgi:hypothetical protein
MSIENRQNGKYIDLQMLTSALCYSLCEANTFNQSELRTKVVPFNKKFLSLCCIVNNTEWNGIIKLIIEVKCIRIILRPHLIASSNS